MDVNAPAQIISAPAQLITAPAQLITAPAQLNTAPAQPPATGLSCIRPCFISLSFDDHIFPCVFIVFYLNQSSLAASLGTKKELAFAVDDFY